MNTLYDLLGQRVWDGWAGGEIVGIRKDPDPQALIAWDSGAASWIPVESIRTEGPCQVANY